MESVDFSKFPIKGTHFVGAVGIVSMAALMYFGVIETEVGVGIITSIMVGVGAYGQGKKTERKKVEVDSAAHK